MAEPDGTLAAGYRFLHELYQEVIYERIPPTRKARPHRQIAMRLEEAYGARATEHAAELAMHFVQARDSARALRFLAPAAASAMHLGGYREAIEHFSAAVAIAATHAALPNRGDSLVALHAGLGGAYLATEGYGSDAAVEAYTRALEAAEQGGDQEGLANVVYSLAALHQYRAEHEAAAALLRRVDPGRLSDDPSMRVPYHALLSCSCFHQGLFADSVDHAGKGLAVVDPRPADPRYAFMGEDAGNGCREWSALARWFLGYPDQALTGVLHLYERAA